MMGVFFADSSRSLQTSVPESVATRKDAFCLRNVFSLFPMPGQFGRRQSSLGFRIAALPPRRPPDPASDPPQKASDDHSPLSKPSWLARVIRAEAALPPLAATPTRMPHTTPLALNPQLLYTAMSPLSPATDDPAAVPTVSDLMREQCVLFVCRRCQQGVTVRLLDSTTADSCCALLQQNEAFGRRAHSGLTLWFKGQHMQAMGSLHDYGVQVRGT